eukprot:m.5174 g.5174  ORF g.5174 m.5174 type:complete len:119 (-) comp4149_c0_seq2:2191-2547(-)
MQRPFPEDCDVTGMTNSTSRSEPEMVLSILAMTQMKGAVWMMKTRMEVMELVQAMSKRPNLVLLAGVIHFTSFVFVWLVGVLFSIACIIITVFIIIIIVDFLLESSVCGQFCGGGDWW